MNYRSLLVLLDNDPGCAHRTGVAIRLAADHSAHLVGFAPTGLIDIPPAAEAADSLSNYAALAWDVLRDRAEWATQNFRNQCHAARLESFEAIIEEADTAPSLVRRSHCSDLVIVSQARRDAGDDRRAHRTAEQVVLESARPTLIVPREGRFERIGTKVLLAWDDSREAARALSDALPLLARASRVELVLWREAGKVDDSTLPARMDEVHAWLLRHSVVSHIYTQTAKGDLAAEILSRAAEINADLIVMGAYGHPRWAQRVLGGATRGMLEAATIPVLMSH